jgi:excisionase family DNA binding protein
MASGALNDEAVSPPRKRSNPGQPAHADQSPLLDVFGLADWLGVEVVFVRRLVAERRIPFLKIGKFVRFDPGEVSVWIDRQRVSPVDLSSTTRMKNRG